MHGMGRVWAKFELGRAPILEERVFDFMGKKAPKNIGSFPHALMFSSSLTFWGAAGCFGSWILHSWGTLM